MIFIKIIFQINLILNFGTFKLDIENPLSFKWRINLNRFKYIIHYSYKLGSLFLTILKECH